MAKRKHNGTTHINEKACVRKIEEVLYKKIKMQKKEYSKIVVVCVGTDRSTGDSLGPMIGTFLSKRRGLKGKIDILGTLDYPVHAKNLKERISAIDTENSLVIAIDASLGKIENIGKIDVKKESLRPGAGVGKDLPHVGDIAITAVVNLGGCMEYIVLQNTRLSFIFQLAQKIELGLNNTLKKILAEENEMNNLKKAIC